MKFLTTSTMIFFFQVAIFAQTKKIVIDPGHGYCVGEKCPGTSQLMYNGVLVKNPDGRCKAEIESTLAVAQLLKSKLESTCSDIEVLLTRNSNIVDAEDNRGENAIIDCSKPSTGFWLNASARACYANYVNADLFISIHSNALGNSCVPTDSGANGTETYYCTHNAYSSNGLNSNLESDRSFATMVNKLVSGKGEVKSRNPKGESEEWKDKYNKSFHLGALFYNNTVLKAYNEIAYHTNIDDHYKLTTESWQTRFADAYYEAIVDGLKISCNDKCNDKFEPNNSNLSAHYLSSLGKPYNSNELIESCIDITQNDEDWYSIGMSSQGNLEVVLKNAHPNLVLDAFFNDQLYKSAEVLENGDRKIQFCVPSGVCSSLNFRVASSFSNQSFEPTYELEFSWVSNVYCNPDNDFTEENLSKNNSTQLIINGSTSICKGDIEEYCAEGGSGKYIWIIDEKESSSENCLNIESISDKDIQIILQDALQPCNYIEQIVILEEYVNANAGVDRTIQKGNTIQLIAIGGSNYSWSPASSLSNPNIWNPIASPDQTTTYTVTVRNGECSATDQVTIFVEGTEPDVGNSTYPVNDVCTNATQIESSNSCRTINGTVDFAQSDGLSKGLCDAFPNASGKGVFYSFIAKSSTHEIEINPTGKLDAVVVLYKGGCGGLNQIACEDTPGGAGGLTRLLANGLELGTRYYIRVYDYGSLSPAIGEGGFSICVTHEDLISSSGFDLVPSISGLSKSNPDAGDEIKIEIEIANNGNEAVPFGFISTLFISTDTNFDEHEDLFLENGAVSINNSIAANASYREEVEVNLPSDLGEGQYYILFIADRVNINQETNENNNIANKSIQIGEKAEYGPNLDVKGLNVNPSTNLAPNQEITVEADIKNEGNKRSSDFYTAFIFDRGNDGNYDPSEDVILGEIKYPRLEEGERDTRDREFFLPSDITSTGSYQIIAIADFRNQNNETDEGDNEKSTSINVSTINPAGPDLVCDFIKWEIEGTSTTTSSNKLCLGERYRLYWSIENIGNLDASGGNSISHSAFISKDQELDGSDIFFDRRRSSAGTYDVGFVDLIDDDNNWEGMDPGEYFLILQADEDYEVEENNESNNIRVFPITLSNCNNAQYPDISIEILDFSPYQAAIGDYIDAEIRIKNEGDLPVSNIDIELFLSEDQKFHGDGGSDSYSDHQLADNGLFVYRETLDPGEEDIITMRGYIRTDNSSLLDPINSLGVKYLIASADEGGDYIEYDRSNNIDIKPIEIVSLDCYFNFDVTSNYTGQYPWDQKHNVLIIEARTEENCEWSVTSPQDWIFFSKNSFIGRDYIDFTTYENSYPFSRKAQIYINNEPFYELTQDPKPCDLISEEFKTIAQGDITPVSQSQKGKIDITVDQGFPPYSYSWTNGSTSQNLLEVASGTYSVTISDLSECITEISFVVPETECPNSLPGANTNEPGCTDQDGDGYYPGAEPSFSNYDPDDSNICIPDPSFGQCDKDSDGVNNDDDLCGNTPLNTPVNVDGCKDIDGDGYSPNLPIDHEWFDTEDNNVCIPSDADPVCKDSEVSLNLKIFLQGAYDCSAGLMTDVIRQKGLIPYEEPYSLLKNSFGELAFDHIYDPNEITNEAVLSVSGQDAIVDWVYIALRDQNNPNYIHYSKAALLQRDGDIVDVDGISPVKLAVSELSYFIEVNHRNHLGVMTSQPVTILNESLAFDFTYDSNLTHGVNSQRSMSNFVSCNGSFDGVNALWAGDADLCGSIVLNGAGACFPEFIQMAFDVLDATENHTGSLNYIVKGYYSSDTNMDGEVRAVGGKNDIDEMVFFNVLQHPENPLKLLNYTIKEQIPK